MEGGAFKVGDIVNTRLHGRAKILGFRMEVSDARRGWLDPAADVMYEDGRTGYQFLANLAADNPEFVKRAFG